MLVKEGARKGHPNCDLALKIKKPSHATEQWKNNRISVRTV